MATRLKVRVTPRASKNEIVGWRDGVLIVRTTAPPIEGAANKACIELVAKTLGVKRSQVSLVHGDKSRDKTFEIADLSDDDLKRIVESR